MAGIASLITAKIYMHYRILHTITGNIFYMTNFISQHVVASPLVMKPCQPQPLPDNRIDGVNVRCAKVEPLTIVQREGLPVLSMLPQPSGISLPAKLTNTE